MSWSDYNRRYEQSLVDWDFQDNGVDSDHDGYTDCEAGGCDQVICRCYTITDAIVDRLNFKEVYNNIMTYIIGIDKNDKKEIRNKKINDLLDESSYFNGYFIYKILTIEKLWSKDSYVVNYGGDYYGDEVYSITLKDDIAKRIDDDFKKLNSYTNLEQKLLHLLVKEYGDYHTDLIGKKLSIKYIDKKDIILGQQNHIYKIKQMIKNKELTHYSDDNYNMIRGIVVKSDNKYKLIDGYHRMLSTNKDKVEVIVAE